MATGLLARTGGEFVANMTTVGDQSAPLVAALASGGYVIIWDDVASGHGVVAQLYDAAGQKVGGELVINSTYHSTSTLTALSTGGFAVTWYVSTFPATATPQSYQIFDSSGSAVTPVFSTMISGFGAIASTAPLAGGGFIGVTYGAVGQIFDAAGQKVGAEIALPGSNPVVATLSDGTFVVAVQSSNNVLLRHYSSNGAVIGADYSFSDPSGFGVFALSISSNPSGGFAVAWQTSSDAHVAARGFANDLTPTSNAFIVSESITAPASQANVLGVGSGKFLVSWTATNAGGIVASDVRGHVYDSTGAPLGSEFLISQQTDSPNRDHGSSDAALLASGAVVTVWQGSGPGDPRAPGASPPNLDHGIRGQIFSPLDHALSGTAPSATSISEAAVNNVVALGFNSTSTAANDSYTYQMIADTTGGAFAIHDNQLVVVDNTLLHGDAPTSVTIRTTDAAGDTRDDIIDLTVRAENTLQRYTGGTETTVVQNYSDKDAAITRLQNGGYVIAWADGGNADGHGDLIRAQIYDEGGQAVGSSFLAYTTRTLSQGHASVTTLDSGNFVVTWYGTANQTIDTFAQVFSPTGDKIGNEIAVNTTLAGAQYQPVTTALANGGFVVAWQDDSATSGDTSGRAVRMQVFDANGAKVGGERLVDTVTSGHQDSPSVAGLTDGTFIVTWTDASAQGGDTSLSGIKAQHYAADGTSLGSEFLVNTQTSSTQRNPTVIALGDGYVVSWIDRTLVKSQKFDAAGHAIGGELTIAAGGATTGGPTVGQLPGGGFVVAWASSTVNAADPDSGSIMAQVIDAAGNKVGDNFVVNDVTSLQQLYPNLITQPDGTFTIVWNDTLYPLQRFRPDIRSFTPQYAGIAGGNGDDVLTGSSGDDIIHGFAGTDRLIGNGGTDTLVGGIGDDTYVVPDQSTTIVENPGEGFDTVETSLANYVLPANIERLIYTGNGAVSWSGTAGKDYFGGAGGDDFFNLGQGGSDTASGGAGNDGFYLGATFDPTDAIDGGTGTLDSIGLQGSYAGLTLGANSMTGIELVALLSGSDTRYADLGGALTGYDLTLNDGNVAAGATLTFQANTLHAGENFTLDASAETDGKVLTYAGFGTETLTGGQSDDGFYFGAGRFGASDRVDGQSGFDSIGLQGDFSGANALTFGANQLSNVELIALLSGADTRFNGGGSLFSYTLTMNDGNVAANTSMIVQGNALHAGEVLTFDGSAETNGSFRVFAGAGNDSLTGSHNGDQIYGGAGDDILAGMGGADQLYGGAGNDTFRYLAIGDSAAGTADQIQDFASGDHIDLTAVDGNAAAGQQQFTFIGSSAFDAAGQLRVTQTGSTALVQGDVNGDGVADFAINVTVADGHTLGLPDFIGVTGGSGSSGGALITDLGSQPAIAPVDSSGGAAHLMLDHVDHVGFAPILAAAPLEMML